MSIPGLIPRVALGSAVVLAVALLAPLPAHSFDESQQIETSRVSLPVATGVTHDSFDQWSSNGWLRADSLTVDLSSGASVEYLSPETVSQTAPISEQVASHKEAVAAINGDFFDINGTDAPLGVGLAEGELVKSANVNRTNAVGITSEGLGEILQVDFEGTVEYAGTQHPLSTLNTFAIPKNSIGEYTAAWGTQSRARATGDASEVCEVVVSDGLVTAVSDQVGTGPILEDTYALVSRDEAATSLCQLNTGDPVDVTYAPKTSTGSTLYTALGGNQILVSEGEILNHPDDGKAARSAVGFSSDGATMYLLTVDGKQAHSVGITVGEMAHMMKELGAHNAINIDGGGSSTMMTRQLGSDELSLVNGPSDGSERPVANGLAITVPKGSGKLTGYHVETTMDPVEAPGDQPMPGGSPERVFPGLTRDLSASGYDEAYSPSNGKPKWKVSDRRVGSVNSKGIFTAKHSGSSTVSASTRKATGSIDLTVLDNLARINTTVSRVGLASQQATGHFGVYGYDRNGYTAPIEPADIVIEYDHDIVTLTPDETGFTVSALTPDASTLVTITVGGHSVELPVTVGLDTSSVANFDDAGDWVFSAARATGSLAAGEGYDGTGLALNYDFTTSTATRAAYASPSAPIAIPGQPQSFSLWINGQGNGEWPSLQFKDGAGAALILRGDFVTWTGWQQVEMTVPEGTIYPLTLDRFYVAETDPTSSYDAGIIIDELVANTPPSIELPVAPELRDRIIKSNVDGYDWQFAVMSDAQFVARDPDSEIVASARRTLTEIKESQPDFLVINGDLVDEGSPADLAFARQILTEELGDEVPWYYLPGNHEVMGGNIDNFVNEFGDAYRSFDHQGTRFVMLDTSSLKIHSGGIEQMTLLRDQLDSAATNDDITSVVVIEHVPPRDPMPAAASQLTDRKDAQIIEEWLSEFGASTGKGVAFIGSHVGIFHASRVDGVPYFINGNSGKTPAGAAADGGFVGWSEVGISTAKRPHDDWIGIETHAQTDNVEMNAPETVAVNQTIDISASLTQQNQLIPVAYPVSATWQGDDVYVGNKAPNHGRYKAWFNPDMGTLTGIQPGQVTLTVTVNGVTASIGLTVTRR